MDGNVSDLESRLPEKTYSDIQQQRGTPISYSQPHSYDEMWRKERRDITKFTPNSHMQKFPLNGNEGLYGWTLKNKDGKVHIRDDLYGFRKLETDLHECGHTEWEYETRRRTDEKMKIMFPEVERYQTKPPEYPL